MMKKILIGFAVIFVAAGAGAFFYLDSIVSEGIEVAGTRALGTSVSVGSVALSPLNGAGRITELRIDNPEGFDADSIFELGYVSLNLDISSLFSDVIEIESVTIAQPLITYETCITTDNVRALLANLPDGDAGDALQPKANEPAKQIIIRELHILNPQLTLSAGTLSAPIQLPDLLLTDIGTAEEAASVEQALRVVLDALRAEILQADLPSLDVLRDSIENSVQETLEDAGQAIDGAIDNLGSRLRQLGN